MIDGGFGVDIVDIGMILSQFYQFCGRIYLYGSFNNYDDISIGNYRDGLFQYRYSFIELDDMWFKLIVFRVYIVQVDIFRLIINFIWIFYFF